MQPITFLVGPLATASSNAVVTSITPTSGTALTLTGAAVSGGVATFATARRILATYGSEGSARTLRITGTNSDGNPIRETLVIPATTPGSGYTVQDFLTVTEILPAGGGWSAALTVGTNTIASSPWKLMNSPNQSSTEMTFDGHITAGAGTWGIEWMIGDLNDNAYRISGALGNYPTPPIPHALTILTLKSTDAYASVDNPMSAWRAIINNAGDTTFQVQVRALEGGVTESR